MFYFCYVSTSDWFSCRQKCSPVVAQRFVCNSTNCGFCSLCNIYWPMWVLECRKEPWPYPVCRGSLWYIFHRGVLCFLLPWNSFWKSNFWHFEKASILKLPVHLIMRETTCRHRRRRWCINVVVFKIALFMWKCSEDFFFFHFILHLREPIQSLQPDRGNCC